MMTRDVALELIGVPYVLGGRDPATGLDCVGVVLAALRMQGIELADPWDGVARCFAEGWTSDNDCRPRGWKTILPDPKLGWPVPLRIRANDVLVVGAGGVPTHVGIAVDHWYGIHCTSRGHWLPGMQGVSRLVEHEKVRRHLLWLWRREEAA